MPRSRHKAPMAATSSSTPVSLFANMIAASTVSGRGVDTSAGGRGEPAHPEAFLLQTPARIEYRLVFGARGDEVTAAVGVAARTSEYRQIVGFGGTGGEHNLTRLGTDQRRHLSTRLRDARRGR